jgi:hypothetical protein
VVGGRRPTVNVWSRCASWYTWLMCAPPSTEWYRFQPANTGRVGGGGEGVCVCVCVWGGGGGRVAGRH